MRDPKCKRPTSSGSMTFRTDGRPAAKVDLHQLGSGQGGHFWLTHTKANTPLDLKASITADWQLNQKLRGRSTVYAFIPAHGSKKATKARYQIETAQGLKTVEKNQTDYKNMWMPVGTFDFDNKPKVSLSSVTDNGSLGELMAFDAIAFGPETFFTRDTDRVTRFVNNGSGKCFAPAESFSNPSPVVQVPCLDNFSDNWLIRRVGDHEEPNPNGQPISYNDYQFIHQSTGLCLEVKDSSLADGAPLQTRTCSASQAEKNQLFSNHSGLLTPRFGIMLRTFESKLILAPAGNSTADGAAIQQRHASEGDNPSETWDL